MLLMFSLMWIMPPRMRTRSVSQPVAELQGGGTGGQVGRGGEKGRGPRGGNDKCVDDLNGQGMTKEWELMRVGNQGNVGNQNGNVVNENVQENVRNVLMNGNRIEKMESVHDMSGCSIDQKVKYTAGSFVGKALTWWNSQIRTLSREVAISMSWNDFKFMMIEEFCPSHEMQKLETELWIHAMVGAGHAVYTNRFYELARLVPHLVTPESRMIERYVYGLAPQISRMVAATELKTIQKAVQISGALTDEAVRNESIKKDPNIVTGTFTLNNHFATTLFDYGADYSFVSTTFIPLLGLEPSELGFKYEIEIASGQLVEIDKVIKGCKLEIEGHVFDIDLIPFGHGSFDVIIGMDWLSNYKAEIICHEKVVRIPLPDGKVLRVLGERPEEKARFLMGAKAGDKKQEEIVVVRDFPEFLRHVINGNGIHVDHSKIEAVKNWKAPENIAKSLTILTQKNKTFEWGEEQEMTFQTLKDKLCNAPILALPNGPKDFVVYCDASGIGLGYIGGLGMKKDIAEYVSKCLTCLKVKAEHSKAIMGFAPVNLEIPIWKWEGIAMDFVTKLPRTSGGHDTIWAEVGEGDYCTCTKVVRLGMVCIFGKKGMLAPWFVGPFEIDEKEGPCGLSIRVDAKLNFVEEPMEILEREFKKLNRSMIAIVKVRGI
ncbi:reverse transcriptase domain-containing protein [Tanacetum coccineum]